MNVWIVDECDNDWQTGSVLGVFSALDKAADYVKEYAGKHYPSLDLYLNNEWGSMKVYHLTGVLGDRYVRGCMCITKWQVDKEVKT